MRKISTLFLTFTSIVSIFLHCHKNPTIEQTFPNTELKGILKGTVNDKIAYPIYAIAEAKIILRSSSYLDTTYTDEHGNFTFDNIISDLYELIVIKTNYNTKKQIIEVSGGDSVNLIIELMPSYEYDEGAVLVGFFGKDSVQSVFPLFDSLGLSVKSLKGFEYRSRLPVDSIDFVHNVLFSKSYLSVTEYTVFVYQGMYYKKR